MSAATKAFKERALVTLENLSPDNVEGFYYPAFIGEAVLSKINVSWTG
jgi:hypothetical protein